MAHPDTRPAIIRAVEHWNRVLNGVPDPARRSAPHAPTPTLDRPQTLDEPDPDHLDTAARQTNPTGRPGPAREERTTRSNQDTRPEIIRAVERWNRALNGAPEPGRHRTSPGHTPKHPDRDRLIAAACRAGVVYPGAAGELIHREIRAVVDFGYQFTGSNALVTRVADQVLAAAPGRRTGDRPTTSRIA